jgi:hypothetical protein
MVILALTGEVTSSAANDTELRIESNPVANNNFFVVDWIGLVYCV